MSHKSVEITNFSFPKLISYLDNNHFDQALEYLRDNRMELSSIERFIHFDDEHYTRVCLSKSNDYELILLCWDKEQGTQIHCHDGQECYVDVLQGDLRELVYTYDRDTKQLDLHKENVVHTGESADVEPGDFFHSLENVSSGKSLSLHLYVSPISNCMVYNPVTREFDRKELEYDWDYSEIEIK